MPDIRQALRARLEGHQNAVAQHIAGQHQQADDGQALQEGALTQAGEGRHGAGREVGQPGQLHARARRIDDDQFSSDGHRHAAAFGCDAHRLQQPGADLGREHAQRVAEIELQRGHQRQRQQCQARQRPARHALGQPGAEMRTQGQRGQHRCRQRRRQQPPGRGGQRQRRRQHQPAQPRLHTQCRCRAHQPHHECGQGSDPERVVRTVGPSPHGPQAMRPQRGGVEREPTRGGDVHRAAGQGIRHRHGAAPLRISGACAGAAGPRPPGRVPQTVRATRRARACSARPHRPPHCSRPAARAAVG